MRIKTKNEIILAKSAELCKNGKKHAVGFWNMDDEYYFINCESKKAAEELYDRLLVKGYIDVTGKQYSVDEDC